MTLQTQVIFGDITFAEHSLEVIKGIVLFDAILESALSFQAKHEITEWLWANRKIDDNQYRLAQSRIDHLERKRK